MGYRNCLGGLVATLLTLGLSLAAQGQQPTTVGDLLSKGGKKLVKEELQAMYAGAVVSGVQSSTIQNITFKSVFAANGSVRGDAWDKGKPVTSFSGTWSVSDSGQYCSNLVNSQGQKINACAYYYVLDGHYYAGGTGEPSSKLAERKFERQ